MPARPIPGWVVLHAAHPPTTAPAASAGLLPWQAALVNCCRVLNWRLEHRDRPWDGVAQQPDQVHVLDGPGWLAAGSPALSARGLLVGEAAEIEAQLGAPGPFAEYRLRFPNDGGRVNHPNQGWADQLQRLRAGRAGALPSLRTAGRLWVDGVNSWVFWEGQELALTGREFDLVSVLAETPGALVPRARIESRVYRWSEPASSNALDVLVHQVRRKTAACLIETVRGEGFRLQSPNEISQLPG